LPHQRTAFHFKEIDMASKTPGGNQQGNKDSRGSASVDPQRQRDIAPPGSRPSQGGGHPQKDIDERSNQARRDDEQNGAGAQRRY
jgi:hypothetical protein